MFSFENMIFKKKVDYLLGNMILSFENLLFKKINYSLRNSDFVDRHISFISPLSPQQPASPKPHAWRILVEATDSITDFGKQEDTPKQAPGLAPSNEATDLAMSKFLISNCLKDLNGKVEGGFNALHIAARGGFTDMTLKLLVSGVRIHIWLLGRPPLAAARLHPACPPPLPPTRGPHCAMCSEMTQRLV